MGFVIVLSVFLIASVATMVNSIDLTITTIYGYTKAFTMRSRSGSRSAYPKTRSPSSRPIHARTV
jgi:hypothetical protein